MNKGAWVNAVGNFLSAKIRGVVATALGSKHGEEVALADLRRTGLSEAEITALRTQPSEANRVALSFAEKLTEEGHAITDKEFAEVLKHFGPEKVTAIVHTVAFSKFQNRIVLGFGAGGDPVPPVVGAFSASAAESKPSPSASNLRNTSNSPTHSLVETSPSPLRSIARNHAGPVRAGLPMMVWGWPWLTVARSCRGNLVRSKFFSDTHPASLSRDHAARNSLTESEPSWSASRNSNSPRSVVEYR